MRIAIPIAGEEVFSPLGGAEAFRFYEDDHGRIVRQFLVPMEGSGTDAAIRLLERYGITVIALGSISAGLILPPLLLVLIVWYLLYRFL